MQGLAVVEKTLTPTFQMKMQVHHLREQVEYLAGGADAVELAEVLREREAEIDELREENRFLERVALEAQRRTTACCAAAVASKSFGCEKREREDGAAAIGKELAETRDELLATEENLIATREVLTETRDELRATGADLTATKDELISTREELTAARGELHETDVRVALLEEKVSGEEKRREAAEAEREAVALYAKKERRERQRLERELYNEATARTKQAASWSAAAVREAELLSRVAPAEDEVVQLRLEVDGARANIAALAAARDEARREARAAVGETRAARAYETAALRQRDAAVSSSKSSDDKKIDALLAREAAAIASLSNDVASLSDEVAALERERDGALSDLAKLGPEEEKLRAERRELLELIQSKDAIIAGLTTDLGDLEAQRDRAEAEGSQLRLRLSTLEQDQLEELELFDETTENRIAQLAMELEKVEADRDEARRLLEDARTDISELRRRVSTLEQYEHYERDLLDQTSEERIAQLAIDLARVEADRDDSKRLLEEARHLEGANTDKIDLQQQVSTLEEQQQRQHDALLDETKELSQLRADLGRVEADRDEVRRLLGNTKAETIDLLGRVEAERDETTRLLEEAKAEGADLRQQVSSLREQLEDPQQQLEELELLLQVKEEEIGHLRTEVEGLEVDREESARLLEDTEAKASFELAELRSQVARLETARTTTFDEKEAEVASLTKRIRDRDRSLTEHLDVQDALVAAVAAGKAQLASAARDRDGALREARAAKEAALAAEEARSAALSSASRDRDEWVCAVDGARGDLRRFEKDRLEAEATLRQQIDAASSAARDAAQREALALEEVRRLRVDVLELEALGDVAPANDELAASRAVADAALREASDLRRGGGAAAAERHLVVAAPPEAPAEKTTFELRSREVLDRERLVEAAREARRREAEFRREADRAELRAQMSRHEIQKLRDELKTAKTQLRRADDAPTPMHTAAKHKTARHHNSADDDDTDIDRAQRARARAATILRNATSAYDDRSPPEDRFDYVNTPTRAAGPGARVLSEITATIANTARPGTKNTLLRTKKIPRQRLHSFTPHHQLHTTASNKKSSTSSVSSIIM